MTTSPVEGEAPFEGHRIAYTVRGEGERPLVLLHGQLLSQKMHERMAEALAARGHRVITVDLLGHGKSSRPPDMWRYSMSQFAEHVLAVMDHLGIEEAAVGGTSLGANTTLEVCAHAPERVRAMVVEMPVLDNALLAGALAFTPMMTFYAVARPVAQLIARSARLVPSRGIPWLLDVGLDAMRQDPDAHSAVIQGIFYGRIAPHRTLRRAMSQPALIIGHHRDPIHPFSDADMLAEELTNGRLVQAHSILELRLRPERLTREIDAFLSEAWATDRVAVGAR